jgi:8-oxo-dGTP pyrophosphatase MutT (NUDIX family)
LSANVKIVRADRLDCRCAPYRWEFDDSRGAEIDAFWRARTSANPALYDGRVLLANRIEHGVDARRRAVLSMDFFETRFSRFLAWRDFGFPDAGVYNCFAMPALRSSDGAFLLGEMNTGHSSAGQLYFPAGTPDPSDLKDGRVDLEGSIIRELAEEAGLDARLDELEEGWTVVFESQRVACMKIIDWPEPAAAILSRVSDFIARETHPELAGAQMISRREQLADPRLPAFMTAFLAEVLPA